MSVRIRVSYQTDEELKQVLLLLDPIIKDWNKASKQAGRFQKVYIETGIKK